jgi:ubiquinone/menaquinone biosynthesis C-methylase UbiE
MGTVETIDTMQTWDPRGAKVCELEDLFREFLSLKEARVLDLGCGSGDVGRAIAESVPGASVVCIEIDALQYAENLESAPLPNLEFKRGGAEKIPERDEGFDVVLMMKSLHHVPTDQMDQALREVRRVLHMDGLAFIVEPVFGGAFNEILRIFHDEKEVRLAAFEAVRNAISSGSMELVEERFFLTSVTIPDFDVFEQRYINVTHSEISLSSAQRAEVRQKFERHMKPDGATFKMPMRLDLLKKAN